MSQSFNTFNRKPSNLMIVHILSKPAAKLKDSFCFLSCGMKGKNLCGQKWIGNSGKMTPAIGNMKLSFLAAGN